MPIRMNSKHKPGVWFWPLLIVIALLGAGALSYAENPRKYVLWGFAAIFASQTARSLWTGHFFYRSGERIERRLRPVEYWFVMGLAIAATAILSIIALGITLGGLPAR